MNKNKGEELRKSKYIENLNIKKEKERENDESKLEFMLQELNMQQQNFFERARNCDVKLGIIIALISGIILYIIPNIEDIFYIEWINQNGLAFFLILFLLDIAIVSLLFIGLIFALFGIKTRKASCIGPKMFGKGNLDKNKYEILKKAVTDTEEIIEFNLDEEKKKNKSFDISVILIIISFGLIIINKVVGFII